MPSEYYPYIFDGAVEDTCRFETLEDANAILNPMMRHWNNIAAASTCAVNLGPSVSGART